MADEISGEVTQILQRGGGDGRSPTDELLPLVYPMLRRLAHNRMANEAPGQTLQPTALVHEAYLKLVGNQDIAWENRGHFFAAAARAMRQILIDRARRKRAVRHGGDRGQVDLESLDEEPKLSSDDRLLALDEALDALQATYPRHARIVMLKHFAGLSVEEISQCLTISTSTVTRDWRFARAWLHEELNDDE